MTRWEDMPSRRIRNERERIIERHVGRHMRENKIPGKNRAIVTIEYAKTVTAMGREIMHALRELREDSAVRSYLNHHVYIPLWEPNLDGRKLEIGADHPIQVRQWYEGLPDVFGFDEDGWQCIPHEPFNLGILACAGGYNGSLDFSQMVRQEAHKHLKRGRRRRPRAL